MQSQPTIVNSQRVAALEVLGAQVRFLCEGHETSQAWSLMHVTLPLDAGPPPHRHQWAEAYFVTAGEVAFSVGERHFVAGVGDFVHAPAGVVHALSGASQQPAQLLIFDAPAHAGAFFKRVDREVGEMPRDLPKVLAIGAQTGVEFMPPG